MGGAYRASAIICLSAAATFAADQWRSKESRVRWNATVQTGLAERFQLTLGGLFGGGPAWQSRLEVGADNVWTRGDTLSFYGAESLDRVTTRSDWQSGVAYRRPIWRGRNQLVSGSGGFQHWRFANVKTGTRDWLTYENLTYRAKVKSMGFGVTADSWSLLSSPLPRGSLLHTQAWAEHTLIDHEPFFVTVRHGPAHTYSWGFFDAHGHRVVRYQAIVGITYRGTHLDVGFRKQLGLQSCVPDNFYWHFSLSRTFRLR
ncbi:MAG: hypothetical protein JNN08_19325 [Bryobacterales bacterium]|nr:hypothetical protein [Bryobacterales bacterium]